MLFISYKHTLYPKSRLFKFKLFHREVNYVKFSIWFGNSIPCIWGHNEEGQLQGLKVKVGQGAMTGQN